MHNKNTPVAKLREHHDETGKPYKDIVNMFKVFEFYFFQGNLEHIVNS